MTGGCGCGDDDDDASAADAGADAAPETDAGPPAAVAIAAAPTLADALGPFVAPLAPLSVTLTLADDPVAAVRRVAAEQRLALVVDDDACAECYALERDDDVLVARGGAPLGVQYGAADALERMGLRFFSPWQTMAAADFPRAVAADDPALGHSVAPEMSVRGLQMHTLHPTEALFDFSSDSSEGEARAGLVVDWLVKNRGNLLVWVPLDGILTSAETRAAWSQHQAPIVEAAHARGVRVGYNIQLFGESNLQHAYDLLDEVGTVDEQRAAIEDRLDTLLDGIPIDVLLLSFGEFLGTEPEQFLESAGLFSTIAGETRPDVDLGGLIHVSNEPGLRVQWQGEEINYYFLVAWVDPPIVPWVHTVMYYDLFDDAGGAYHFEDFSEHRDFLVGRLRDGETVGYQPETAYWVAFDDSVPQYLPVYVRSRLRDLTELRAISDGEGIDRLDRHMLFSTGWEWGYWQNDWAALHASHTLPPDLRTLVREMLAVHGETGRALADAIADLADLQHHALIEQRLAGYLAGSDAVIDLGRDYGVVSQPDPVEIDELVAMSPAERTAFVGNVLEPLDAFAAAVEAVEARVNAEPVEDDPWLREIRDGVAVDARRARYVARLLGAVVQSLEAGDGETSLAEAESLLEDARTIVARRHADLRYPDPERLLGAGRNATVYPFGYLRMADTLCYWERERVLAANVVRGLDDRAPGCVD